MDEFEDLTLLYTDFVGFNTMTRKFEDQRDTINLLNKVFTRFDQLCEEYRVYKVHTIGNQFVLMGYNGKVEKNRRNKQVVIDEASRVIQVGFEMLDYIKEIGAELRAKHSGEMKIRIGIHTGRVVAGIIGSKIVRYDVLGEGVLITKKLQLNGEPGSVCVSEDTKNIIMQAPEIASDYYFDEQGVVPLSQVGKLIKSFKVTQKETDSFGSGSFSNQLYGSKAGGEASERADQESDDHENASEGSNADSSLQARTRSRKGAAGKAVDAEEDSSSGDDVRPEGRKPVKIYKSSP